MVLHIHSNLRFLFDFSFATPPDFGKHNFAALSIASHIPAAYSSILIHHDSDNEECSKGIH